MPQHCVLMWYLKFLSVYVWDDSRLATISRVETGMHMSRFLFFFKPSALPNFLSGQMGRNSNLYVPCFSPQTMPLGVAELCHQTSHPSFQALIKIGDGCWRGCRGNALICEACAELRVAGPQTHLAAGSKQFFPALMDPMRGTKPMRSRFFTYSCRVQHPRWASHDRGQGDRNLWCQLRRCCQLFTHKNWHFSSTAFFI